MLRMPALPLGYATEANEKIGNPQLNFSHYTNQLLPGQTSVVFPVMLFFSQASPVTDVIMFAVKAEL